jgi:sugar phosphate isomerase/epimerase
VCDDLQRRGQTFALETGQESAHGLRCFLADAGSENLRVNFDPANMILYGNDDPIAALEVLMPWIDGVQCKDGRWPTAAQKAAGQLGDEVPLGEGDVNIPLFVEKLLAAGFRGPLTIEREISGEEQRRDILKAAELLSECIARFVECNETR